MHGHEADDFVDFVTKPERFVAIHLEAGVDREWAWVLAGRYMADAATGGYKTEERVREEARFERLAMDEEERAWKEVQTSMQVRQTPLTDEQVARLTTRRESLEDTR